MAMGDEAAGREELGPVGQLDPSRPVDPGGMAGGLLARAAHAHARSLRAALKPHQLSAAQYQLLAGIAALATDPSARRSQALLAARLGMDRAMASAVLTQLEDARLTERAPGADRRMRAPALTRLGQARLAAAQPAVEAAEAHFLAPLRGETTTFAIMLRLLLGERPRIRATAGRG
ncbi:MAG: hypothetical protein EXQ88_03340 [Alphaproteobacteria bacterium]|nr:hypothetical protein [Alphaproteobacteria bacterium]